jgi:hypothetical protein
MSSGGRSGSSYSSRDIEVIHRIAAQRLEQRQLDAEVNSLLQQKLVEINDRDVDLVNVRLDQIRNALGEEVGEIDRLTFGGSVAKHTYVDGLSDTDALLHIKGDLAGLSPDDVRRIVELALRTRLPLGEIDSIRVGKMAVTVRYRDGQEIQLVPAVDLGHNRIAVADLSGQRWSDPIDSKRFTGALTSVNDRQGGMVVPTIKLAKAIFDNRLQGNAPAGYLVEALAVEAFEQYKGPRTHRAMLSYFLRAAANGVLTPTRDPTGQSVHIDATLGPERSDARNALSRRIESIAGVVVGSQSSLEQWRDLLE